MFYLLKKICAESLNDIEIGNRETSYKLFEVRGRKPTQILPKSGENDNLYANPDELGGAIAKYMREMFSVADPIDATEMLEGVEFPIRIPYMDFTDEGKIMVLDRMSAKDYIKLIGSMTKELENR